MLTQDQIDAGDDRLVAGKITAKDINKIVSAMRLFFYDLETLKKYKWADKLAELDDSADPDSQQVAAQCTGALIIMEELGFGVGSMNGGRDAISFKEKDEYWQYVAFIHTKFYELPVEFSQYSWGRHLSSTRAKTSTVRTVRRYH